MLCTNYAQITQITHKLRKYKAEITHFMQKLRRNYAEITHKLCRNYAEITHVKQKLRRNYAEITQKLRKKNYAKITRVCVICVISKITHTPLC